jgi:hypothetical protein
MIGTPAPSNTLFSATSAALLGDACKRHLEAAGL